MRQTTAPLSTTPEGDQLYEPPQSYRPPPIVEDENSSGPGVGERGPFTNGERSGRDLLGAVSLSITAMALVVYAGHSVDAIGDNSLVLGSGIASVISLTLALTIASLTRLPKAPAANLLGLAAMLNALVHIGESNVLGLSHAFIESAILSGLPFGVAWLYVSRKYGRSLRDLGFILPKKPSAFPLAVGVWLLTLVSISLWTFLIRDIEAFSSPDNTTRVFELAGGSIVLAWLLVGLWGPVAEEIFFRGFLLGGLRGRIGRWPAILISSGVFSLFHIHPGLYVPTFLVGVALGWVYLRTRSIWPSILAHALHNTVALVGAWQHIG
jgi:membrane protease YdiL (CAAX protease family)